MAVKRNESKTLGINVITSVSETGKTTIKTNNVKNFNPEVSDDDTYTIGNKLANLLKFEKESLTVTDKYELANA